MSLNHQTRTMQVFDKTCINQSTMSFTKLPLAPRQPPSDYKKVNPMMIG